VSKLILASASPRRKELLEQVGLSFSVFPVEIDETPSPEEPARDYVRRMAREKADCAWRRYQRVWQPEGSGTCENGERHIMLAADTSVILDDDIFGKPVDRADFERMMRRLSGRQHKVVTSVYLIEGQPATGSMRLNSSGLSVTTNVNFKPLSDVEIDAYWQTGEPKDKAGGYGIQGKGAVLVEGIEGSYSNVVGLPLTETSELLAQFDIT